MNLAAGGGWCEVAVEMLYGRGFGGNADRTSLPWMMASKPAGRFYAVTTLTQMLTKSPDPRLNRGRGEEGRKKKGRKRRKGRHTEFDSILTRQGLEPITSYRSAPSTRSRCDDEKFNRRNATRSMDHFARFGSSHDGD